VPVLARRLRDPAGRCARQVTGCNVPHTRLFVRYICADGTTSGRQRRRGLWKKTRGKKKPATHGGGRHRYSIQKIGTGEYYAKINSLFVPCFLIPFKTVFCGFFRIDLPLHPPAARKGMLFCGA